jgi:glyoxylase-like metal-dependent hydrolase (beta-lactamase superfamily II)
MKIHALTTGMVRLKRAFLHARKGPRRQLDLFLPGPWSEPVPIHCWAIEHEGRITLVDTGETADVRDIPFARFDVPPEQELPHVLAAAGLSVDDVESAVVTHLHGDHMDGAVHLGCPVQVHEPELAYARTFGARIFQRLFRQPVPEDVDFQTIALDAGPFGAFEQSRPLSDDGRIVAVGTPGHTVGHISVICIDDAGRHLLLAGDTTDTLEQLQARRPDAVSPKPRVAVATMDAILAHGRQHPTVYLPSHDLESVARLENGTTL